MNSDRMLLKAKAIEFFTQSGIAKDIETSLNSLFKESPKDLHGYISTFFDGLSQPAIVTRVEAAMITGEGGLPTMKVTVYGCYKNEEVILSQVSSPNHALIMPCVPLSLNYISTYIETIASCITLINTQLSPLLRELDPSDIKEVHRLLRTDGKSKQIIYEEKLKESGESESKKDEVKSKVESAKKNTLKKVPTTVVIPDDPEEVLCPLLRSHSVLSMAMSIAAAKITKKTLFQYTKALVDLEDTNMSSTLPMVALLRNGKGLVGKCQLFKRCLLIPNGFYDTADVISADIRLASFTLSSNLQSKTPLITITEQGELVPAFDRPEQFLDLMQEVFKECGLEDKMRIVVEVGARGIFDMDKGKYEVIVGQMKSSDEVVSILADLVDKYPLVVGLLDPLRIQDKDAWRSLGVSVSSHCWLMSWSLRVEKLVELPSNDIVKVTSDIADDAVVNIITDPSTKHLSDPVSVSVMCSSLDGHSLYCDYISYVKAQEGQIICLWLDDLSAEDWMVDLGCGLKFTMLAFPGPRCPSGAAKINRWANLMLSSSSTLQMGLSFPEIYHTSESVAPQEEPLPAT